MAGSGSDASLAIGLSSMYVGPVFITGGFALRKRARTRQGRVGRYWKPEELETIEEEHNTALCGSLGQSMVACNQATSFRPECEFSTTDMEDIQRDLEELEELKDLHQEFDVDWDD